MESFERLMMTLGAFALLIALLATGCSTAEMTNPPRSVTEQLLLSTAMDRALTNTVFTFVSGKRVYLDNTYFDSYDAKYMMGDIRDALSEDGAILVDDVTNSDIIVQPRSGGLSIDSSTSLFGIPKMGVPIPLTGGLDIPEIAIAKTEHQHSIAKIALLAYYTESRKHTYSSGALVGKSYNNYHKILFFSWTGTDIPEKQKR